MDKKLPKNDSPSSLEKQDSEVHSPLIKEDCYIQYGSLSSEEGNIALIREDSVEQSKCMKLCGVLTTLTIEPVVFCFIFGFTINLSILSNMMMDKGCRYYYNYSSDICTNLSNHKTEKENVEILATNYTLYSNLTSFIAAFLMTFIAPWSDKYGRRLPLLVTILSTIVTDIGFILCAFYFESRLEYLVLARLPSECTGGLICVLTIVFSHSSEVSSEKNRTLKYTCVEFAMGLGYSLGGITGGFLYRYYGYVSVYVTVAVMHIFCYLWVLFMVKETTGLDVNLKWHEKAKDFFKIESFKASVTATFRRREGNIRCVLVLLLMSMSMILLNYEAFGSISYIFAHHVYNWDPTIYNIVATSSMLAATLLTLTAVPIFVRIFKFRDFTLGIIGILSMIGRSLLIAFSEPNTYIYYTGQIVGLFTSLSTLAVRASLSKLVEKDELGRVFSFLATCEAIIPILGTIAFSQIFNSTLNVYPNIPYLIGAVLLLLPLGTFAWARKVLKVPCNHLSVSANEHVSAKN